MLQSLKACLSMLPGHRELLSSYTNFEELLVSKSQDAPDQLGYWVIYIWQKPPDRLAHSFYKTGKRAAFSRPVSIGLLSSVLLQQGHDRQCRQSEVMLTMQIGPPICSGLRGMVLMVRPVSSSMTQSGLRMPLHLKQLQGLGLPTRDFVDCICISSFDAISDDTLQ